ncbi:hypothetical protein BDF21DRAFT_451958 [Thamnidium elegans]|nr:hypothetical protein BDF21DRAFT_451958 [Thamnidium elegans]
MTEDVLIGFPMSECNFIAAGIFTSNYPHRKIYLNMLEITLIIPLVVLFCKDPYRNHEINTCSFSSLLLMLEACVTLIFKLCNFRISKLLMKPSLKNDATSNFTTTIHNFDNADYILASKILLKVADCIRYEVGALKKKDLLELVTKKENFSFGELLDKILSIFPNESEEMYIINSIELESSLASLANIATNHLKVSNESLKANILRFSKDFN